MTRGNMGRGIGLLAAAALLTAAPVAVAAGARDLYYERSVMVAADARCGLFTPDLSSALMAAQAQARGAAMRGGADGATLDAVRASATTRADSVGCGSTDLATAARRVREAFGGFSRLQKMIYPGETAAWQADRLSSTRALTWRLSQPATIGADRVLFGIVGQGQATAVAAVASFADGATPYTARIVARDIGRAPEPELYRAGQPGVRLPMSRRMVARSAARVVMAQGRAPAGPLLLPEGVRSGVMFRFPDEAARVLQGLDPREAVAVEFVFAGPGRDVVRTAYVEVGDFAAGAAFLRVAQR